MLFQTTEFLVLMLVVMVCIARLRSTGPQHLMLLAASYVFYGWWDVRFLMLIVLSTVIDYAAALGMAGIKLSHARRLGISMLIFGSAVFFLVPNWPAVQNSETADWSALLGGTWEGRWPAVGICVAFGVLGPLLYGQFFRLAESSRRKAFLALSVIANLGMLSLFKYFNFFAENLVGIADVFGASVESPVLRIALPVGISFYTFQTMSYTIDAYRRQIDPERSFVKLALYVAYFPQLVAGPILRPSQFLPTLDRPWGLKGENVRSGLHLVAVGLFKKVLIADSVGPLADIILNDPQGLPSAAIMLGTAMFAVQIYCDFSGYTDIARGISRMFGVEIPLNFNFPYFSTSIIDFWRRWHISLSS